MSTAYNRRKKAKRANAPLIVKEIRRNIKRGVFPRFMTVEVGGNKFFSNGLYRTKDGKKLYLRWPRVEHTTIHLFKFLVRQEAAKK